MVFVVLTILSLFTLAAAILTLEHLVESINAQRTRINRDIEFLQSLPSRNEHDNL